MSHRLKIVNTALLAFAASSAFAKDNLSIGIVTFSTSDIHTNQMVDTMTAEAKSKGWTVETLNANGDPSQAIAEIKQLVTQKVDAIIVTVFDSTGLAAGLQGAAEAGIPGLTAGGGMALGSPLRPPQAQLSLGSTLCCRISGAQEPYSTSAIIREFRAVSARTLLTPPSKSILV